MNGDGEGRYEPVRNPLSADEESAIRSLLRLAKRWPRSLQLFSAAGLLLVVRTERVADEPLVPLAYISGIPNDGGDPGVECDV